MIMQRCVVAMWMVALASPGCAPIDSAPAHPTSTPATPAVPAQSAPATQAAIAPGQIELAFTLPGELLTEGVAFDPDTRTWYVSSVRHRKILAVDAQGHVRDFTREAADGAGGILGITVDRARHALWASSTALPHMLGYRPDDKDASGLFQYDLATGALRARYLLPHDGRPHALGDVIVSSRGDAYTTDSASPTLYRVPAGAPSGGALEVVLEGGFTSLQGMALSADERTLYLADYASGLHALRLADKTLTHLTAPPKTQLAGIDGLYFHRGRLLATQNGTLPSRVIELTLDPTGTQVMALQILLRGDPRAPDLSLGVLDGDIFYLNAAAGWSHYADDGTPKPDAASPHTILRIGLPRT